MTTRHSDKSEIDGLLVPALRTDTSGSPALRKRLLDRVKESHVRHAGLVTVRAGASDWRDVKDGVRARTLREGDSGASVLIQLAPGASMPMHRHRFLEEGIVLEGRMQMGSLDLGPGDYHVSFPGSRHDRITSADGCLTYLRGTSLGSLLGVVVEYLGGLVPGAGDAPVTVRTAEGAWTPVAPGVEEKRLWHAGEGRSRFVRLAPGARLPTTEYPRASEIMVIFGEVFFGDILVRSQELHHVPAVSSHYEISSDSGGTYFIHEAA